MINGGSIGGVLMLHSCGAYSAYNITAMIFTVAVQKIRGNLCILPDYVRICSKPSIRIDYHHVNVLNNYNKQLYLNCTAQSPLYVVSIPAMEATALQECTLITSTLAYSLLSF